MIPSHWAQSKRTDHKQTGMDGGEFTATRSGKLINNFISANQASYSGGAIRTAETYDTSSVTEIINNTITANTVTGPWGVGGSMFLGGNTNCLVMNNIFYDNYAELSEEIHITNSIIVEIHNVILTPGN
jgi:hypothetical protein